MDAKEWNDFRLKFKADFVTRICQSIVDNSGLNVLDDEKSRVRIMGTCSRTVDYFLDELSKDNEKE